MVWVQMWAWRSLETILPQNSTEYVVGYHVVSIAAYSTEIGHDYSIAQLDPFEHSVFSMGEMHWIENYMV